MSLHLAPPSLFWYWLTERHRIYERRQAGQPKPWTEDVILRDYKFTNVFRQLDRGTVWLTDNFITPNHGRETGQCDLGLLVFNIGWYRLFNWTGTGELLGWQTKWRTASVKAKLKKAQARGEQVFTGAHIVWGEKGLPKIDGVLLSCGNLWRMRDVVARHARHSRSLEAVFKVLIQIRGIGPFIGYEIVTDLRHTSVLQDAHDIDKWANVGPGAMRGLRRLDRKAKPGDALARMRKLLALANDRWPHPGVADGAMPTFRLPQDMPLLELRDIEHSLCEFDKYCRVKFGEGRPRSKYHGAAEEAE